MLKVQKLEETILCCSETSYLQEIIKGRQCFDTPSTSTSLVKEHSTFFCYVRENYAVHRSYYMQ